MSAVFTPSERHHNRTIPETTPTIITCTSVGGRRIVGLYHAVYTSACVSIRASVRKVTHESVDKCRPNVLGTGKGHPLEVI